MTAHYIPCPKRKGLPKKHVDICFSCRWKKSCKPYIQYLQPGLPLGSVTSSQTDNRPPEPEEPSNPSVSNTAAVDPASTPPPCPDKLKDLVADIRFLVSEIEDILFSDHK